MAEIKIQEYKCFECGAIDHGKFFAHETLPMVINCWQCGAGKTLNPQQMMQQQKGMVAIKPKVKNGRDNS